ncbi:MAG TPA: coproporphyrinogen III oxidase, partial [Eubacteriaceae bacterium]|nr:coproporphyrinogen III oxidase [Eubacteriaceae bacterium]
MNQNNLGIYVHIPFCVSKCCYCDFLSFPGIGEDKVEAYFDALMKEIEYRAPIFEGNRIETIYIGGGTPSAVPPFYIEKVIEKIRSMTVLEEGLERTIEINPDSCSDEKLEVYRQIGLNRISMGLQSGQDDVLKKIGRIHTVHQFYDAYERLIRWGFDNINIDLMSGLPGQ